MGTPASGCRSCMRPCGRGRPTPIGIAELSSVRLVSLLLSIPRDGASGTAIARRMDKAPKCSTKSLQIQPVDGIGGCAFGVPHRLPGSRRTWISGSRGLVKPRRLDGSEFCGDTAGSHHETLTCSCNYSHDCAPLGGFCCGAHSANWVLRNNSFYIMTEPIQKV